MSSTLNTTPPSDMCLLLRADAEQSWLHREVIPVLRHLETRDELPEEQIDAALAYLEMSWSEATVRARATDAAQSDLGPQLQEQRGLSAQAGRYHAAVRTLRELVAARVAPLVSPLEPDDQFRVAATSRVLDGTAGPGGCAPRAA